MDPISSSFSEGQLQWMALMFFCYAFGALIYATRIPEKYYPGKYDIFLHSHQIFHILVVIGTLVHLHSIMNLKTFRHDLGTQCNWSQISWTSCNKFWINFRLTFLSIRKFILRYCLINFNEITSVSVLETTLESHFKWYW